MKTEIKLYPLIDRRLIISLALILVVPFASVFGQRTARGLGMAGAYTAIARGVHAPAWNPANLGLPDNPKFSITFVSLEAGVWNNSFTKGIYDKYNGKHWDSDDINDILGNIPEDGLRLDVQSFVKALSFSIGRFALSIGATAASSLQLDKSMISIPLAGNEVGEKYTLDNIDGHGLGIGVVGVSWGQPIPVSFADAFSVGATVNMLIGIGYGTVDKADISMVMNQYNFDLNGTYKATYASAIDDEGFSPEIGFGLDIGAAAQFGERWTVSLGLANIFTSVKFSKLVKSEEGYFGGDSLSVISMEDDFSDSTWSVDRGPITSTVPVVIRLGGAYREGDILLTADYCQGFQKGAWITTKPQFAFGTEWSGLKWLPLRMGFVIGGRVGFGTSFGFGFHPGGFSFDIAVMNRGFVFPNNSKGLILAVDLGIDIHRKKSDVVKIGDF